MENRYAVRRERYQNLLSEFIEKLEAKTETPRTAVIADLKARAINERQVEVTRALQADDEEWQNLAEIEAKKLLTLVINRFARPYCPERGIGYLNFDNEDQKKRVLGEEQSNLRLIEKICGVDLAYDEHNNSVNVYGFDPVRRELGRATVDRLMRERNAITPARIEQLAEQTKKDLFQRIHNDGNRIAKELHINNLSPEIKNMMGALRYRYSFTQNQHFHCAEVGHLCGLLAAELDVAVADARRAGMLHDIGKSMDHSVDGGHAVIGADFIKQHGEADHIVHAVRAHHFDEQPSTNLAYLVIAADAISGARPGARRSTVATYTQKIHDLQTIARGFDGVIDTHVLSAGREVRVYVDGKALDDLRALDLSQKIAHKIEEEMQYPGQIRVTVVRETQAVEYAK
ncbi:MAG: HDIG domain-containing protein [Bdellovibrionales bacterium]|nr:HDIG domain-containing protein [Bdellovibrionales bacterium]